MAKKNTIPMRADPEFRKLIDSSKVNRIKLGKAKPTKVPTDARMTLAVARLFKKYPQLKNELDISDFK